jgi:abequosyltransferase
VRSISGGVAEPSGILRLSVANILLSIAIPTYNRASLLRLCLEQILKQATPYINELEVLVSDNDSTDDTERVVTDIINHGLNITYIRNSENIGAERNVIQCFEKATGKYVLVLGDDDLILDGGLKRIFDSLRENEVGVLYLTSYGFKENYVTERPKKSQSGIELFLDVEKYLEKVHFWVTFLSGNVVNKSLLPPYFNASRFLGTKLPQLAWIFLCLTSSERNAIIYDLCIAAKSENTGGYKLCEVFGKNLSSICDYFINKSIPARIFDIIKRNLVLSFFPNLILILRSGNTGFKMDKEDYYNDLKAVFSNYPYFWFVTVPAIKAPVSLAKTWMRVVMLFDRFIRR